VRRFKPEELYSFLMNDYFPRKYTDKRRLANASHRLSRFILMIGDPGIQVPGIGIDRIAKEGTNFVAPIEKALAR
jgi:hypothetical protein